MPKLMSRRTRGPLLSLKKTRGSASKPQARKTKAPETLQSKRLDDLAKRIRICVKCPLHESRTLPVPGEGKVNARFMVIGEAPGKQEDLAGRPFIGNAGRYLDHVLEGTGLQRADFF